MIYYSGKGKQTMDFFLNPWVLAIGSAVTAELILFFIFGIGKPKRNHLSNDNTKKNQTASPTVLIGKANGDIVIQQNIQQSNIETLHSNPIDTKKSNITPKEIFDYLDTLPPLQKPTVSENYKGIKVVWKVKFVGGHQFPNDKLLQLSMYWEMHLYWIYCSVDPEQYPQLKIMKSDNEFTVEGEIQKIEYHDITLTNCRLII